MIPAVPLLPTLGVPELMIVLLIVVIFFGVGKLPQVFRSMGEGVKAFRDAANPTDGAKDPKEIDVTPDTPTVEREVIKEAEELHR
ncbi:MAG: twin-arginine translocase TatA/TatE family subunit [Alphaproteobacteria bacterium]|nr:twin-arginine translocase TatA/TatE family subunit [Alphaproteobacteria bacterium]